MEKLYQDGMLALAKIARNTRPIASATHIAEVNNPVCGDKVIASIQLQDNIITDASVITRGCALCEAGAGLWIETCTGHSLDEIDDIGQRLLRWLQQDEQPCPIEQAAPLAPVRAIKNRHQCVMLAFRTSTAFTPV